MESPDLITQYRDPEELPQPDPNDPLRQLLAEGLRTGDWVDPSKAFGTFHTIALEPLIRNSIPDEATAIRKAKELIVTLNSQVLDFTFPDKSTEKRSALEFGGSEPGHVVLKFGFNGQKDMNGKMRYNASAPCPLNIFEAYRRTLHEELLKPEYAYLTIVVSLSACTGEIDPDTRDFKRSQLDPSKYLGENSQRVFSNKSVDMQVIKKYIAHKVDGWDLNKWTLDEEKVRIAERKEGTSAQNADRIAEHTFRVSDFAGRTGVPLCIGIGTCADSTREIYPGCNLLSFSGGGLWRPQILDRENNKMYAINDIWNWLNIGDDPPGVRAFSQPKDGESIDPDRIADTKIVKKLAKSLKTVDPSSGLGRSLHQWAASESVTLQRFCDYFLSARGTWVGQGDNAKGSGQIFVTPRRDIPSKSYTYQNDKGEWRTLSAIEICSFRSREEFQDLIDIASAEAKAQNKAIPAELRGMVALHNAAHWRALEIGAKFTPNNYATRMNKRITDWQLNESPLIRNQTPREPYNAVLRGDYRGSDSDADGSKDRNPDGQNGNDQTGGNRDHNRPDEQKEKHPDGNEHNRPNGEHRGGEMGGKGIRRG